MNESYFIWMFYTGLVQPDEDDYGYVSQEASAFYNKLMEKYSSTPSDEPKTSKKSFLKSSAADLNNTKVYIFIFLQYLRTIMIILIVWGNVWHITNMMMSIVWDISGIRNALLMWVHVNAVMNLQVP